VPRFITTEVTDVVEDRSDLQVLRLGDRRAVLFKRYCAPARTGDSVVVNVTATDLELGSGGDDFVVWNLSVDDYASAARGHVMKLRYTPMQTEVLAVEAPESPHHNVMSSAAELDGIPVLAASLHSQLLPVVAGIRSSRPRARIAYVMTDGGALDASFSNTARTMRELGWLEAVVTVGHAVGGDLEAVNVYSGLLAARHVARADVAVVGMGPGVVGTATAFGTTALEMGMTLNAAASLHGRPIAVVRMSEGDTRDRHAGISHHSRTALLRVALTRAGVPVPSGHAGGLHDVAERHDVVEVDASGVIAELETARSLGLHALHMGRGPGDDRLFFLAAGAAGIHAASYLEEG
jgi:hypothetical protein